MKKWIAMILAALMLFSLAACGIDLAAYVEEENPAAETEQQNTETPADGGQTEYVPKAEESRTYKIFKEIWSGPYTMKYETYNKDLENPDNKTVSSTIFMVVDGENVYTEQKSRVGENEVSMQTLVMGDYQYSVEHDLKMIIRSRVRSNAGITAVMEEEEFYMDVNGTPETVTVYGEEFYCERFAGFAESIGYCYDGDELKYILSSYGGVEFISGVLELRSGADSSYFELPADYDKNY